MATIQPQGEDLRKAVNWITEEQHYGTDKSLTKLIEEACKKYNLSPRDAEFLSRHLARKNVE
jgi:hypothetical protein